MLRIVRTKTLRQLREQRERLEKKNEEIRDMTDRLLARSEMILGGERDRADAFQEVAARLRHELDIEREKSGVPA